MITATVYYAVDQNGDFQCYNMGYYDTMMTTRVLPLRVTIRITIRVAFTAATKVITRVTIGAPLRGTIQVTLRRGTERLLSGLF